MSVSGALGKRKVWGLQRHGILISGCLSLSYMYPQSPAVAETGFPSRELSLPFTMRITDVPLCFFTGQSHQYLTFKHLLQHTPESHIRVGPIHKSLVS